MKSKDRIINEMVNNTADVMEAKIEYLSAVAEQFEKKDPESAAVWRKDIPRIRVAIEVIREFGGCWA